MLPLLVSTPHCSGQVPYWLMARMLQTGESEAGLRRRLFKEGDPFTDVLFNIPDVDTTLNAPVSRFVADLNRERTEGGENGVIKMTDFDRRPFYPTGYALSQQEREMRLALYYDPYHATLDRTLRSGRIRFFIDGHSMTAHGPLIGPDQGRPRPALCIGNFGDTEGDPASGPVSCAPPLARGIRDKLAQLLKGPLAECGLPEGPVLNHPFDGGHILRRYSLAPYSVPGVMIEVNRALYFDEETQSPIPGRMEAISKAMAKVAAWITENLP
ncbi:MAG: glutamine synthetase catalytic region [Fibrobacteres bacterium]|nr:glutamine synthetase catalytic region [Fibrobacterota bacterium]